MSLFKVIILYSSPDDEPEGAEKISWVSQFSGLVAELVFKLYGEKIKVIKLSEYDIEPDTFSFSPAIIIPIFSRYFIKSPLMNGYLEVVNREIQHSNKSGQKRSLLLPVHRNRINPSEIPSFLQGEHMFKYYKTDSVTDFVSEYKPVTGENTDFTFWLKTYDLAFEIKQHILREESAITHAEEIVGQMSVHSVYLAQVGLDLENEKESIRRELVRNGITVLPNVPLPEKYADLEKRVREYLNQCVMSVHLVGEDSGKLIRDKGLSVVEIENQLSSDFCRRINDQHQYPDSAKFHRVIWLSDKRETLSVKQKLFIENLKKEFANFRNTDILELPVEDLKNYVVEKYHLMTRSEVGANRFLNKDKKLIYIICDKNGYENVKPIGKVIQEIGFDVIYSNFEGEFLKVRDLHTKSLMNCDGTIIYYGNNDPNWIKSKLLERIKALGLSHENTKNPTAIVVDKDKLIDESFLIDKDAIILINDGHITKESIQPFISQLV